LRIRTSFIGEPRTTNCALIRSALSAKPSAQGTWVQSIVPDGMNDMQNHETKDFLLLIGESLPSVYR
jgi:hypothetical protein